MPKTALAFKAYPLARRFLFSLDPETAHELSLSGLDFAHRWLGGLLPAPQPIRGAEPIELAGLRFPNRVGLAAGLDKNAAHIDGLSRFGFGFIEVGTVTPEAQPGNPKPRLFRLPEAKALINRFGFNNLGLARFIDNVAHSKWVGEHRGVLGLNIGKNAKTPIEQAADDYLKGLTAVYPWADYVTVNISSPNTKNLRDLQNEQALEALLDQLKQAQAQLAQQHGKAVPLFLKIAPDMDETALGQLIEVVRSKQIDGLIATNTTLDRSLVTGLRHANETGGLSGQPVHLRSLQTVRQLRQELGPHFPIIGVGGILSAADGLAMREAGADLVQVYTGLIYRGPALVTALAERLAR
ncbi:MAG: quinone-dependent dihydroorotate dehydrogenase [Burkholderiaceae bacterium]